MCGRKAPFCRIPMRSRKLSDSEKHSKRSKRRVVWDWLCEGKRGCQREREVASQRAKRWRVERQVQPT